MRDCQHLIVHPLQQLNPFVTAPTVAECNLKDDLAVRVKLAKAASDVLGATFQYNTECHFYNADRCEDCPSYVK